uniref:Intercellular adhesion molecule 1 n=1 Tax=Pipistrellus kuhlii TaxID=59472 RepID=A0A7J7TAV8_PIPKU|nr:intercellular adhesion molecule 1 [Pipistrellus kuhlii]
MRPVAPRPPLPALLALLWALLPEAQVHLALEDQRLEPRIDRSKDSLLATARVEATPGEEGSHPLTCAVSLGNQRRSTQEYVTIYSFPAPNLTLSESEVPEGTEVSVECKAHAGAAVTLSWGPDGSPLPRAQTTLNATAEDDGREFLCSAMLVVAGEELHKHKTQKLSVLHGPRLDQETCPGNWTWEEDTPQTLRCQALGNPTPTLACRREGDRALLPIGDLRPVTRAISGTYVCRATSSRGAVTHEVVVNVIYRQSNLATILAVAGLIVGLAGTVGLAAYLYNRQRKIRKYKLQKAQEQAAMKLNSPP